MIGTRLLAITAVINGLSGVIAQAPSCGDEPIAQNGGGPDVVVVCPLPLQSSLDDWIRRRTGEGLTVRVLEPLDSSQTTRRHIASIAEVGRTRYVVLVGDSKLTPEGLPATPQAYVPTIYAKADATARWQPTPQLPGDHLYGDFDNDLVIDAAVGRLPVSTLPQASGLLRRIAAYEDSRDFGSWRSQVDLVAGLGGFGALVDGAIEAVASGLISGSLPGSVRTRVTHAGPSSPFCPGPDCFTETVLANYSSGCRFWVYAGHGNICELDRVPAHSGGRPVLSVNDLQHLNRPADSAPIALLLACYTGAIDATEDCLAKQMLLSKGGPIAVLAGSRVTMPYGNAAAAMALIHSVYERKPERLGDAWLAALAEMAMPSQSEPELQARRGVIDGLATLLGDGKIDAERREHMQLYNWLGDPTMRLTHPLEITFRSPERANAGETLGIVGNTPLAGVMTIELHRRLSTTPVVTQVKSKQDGNRPTNVNRYRIANDTRIAQHRIDIAEPGPWSTQITLPSDGSGPSILVIQLEGETGYASGSQPIWLRP